MNIVKIKKLHPEAVIPEYKTPGAAGADLVSVEDVNVRPGKVVAVSTGFSVSFPSGYEIQIRPSCGLALNYSVTVVNTPGTIDSDYRGPLKVLLINHGDKVFRISKGDRIAQMILNKVCQAQFIETEQLDKTERNEDGFGSTGTN